MDNNTTNDNKRNRIAIDEEALPGILLLIATIIALIFANTPLRNFYNYILYDLKFGQEFNLQLFINDFLMAIFFLVVGCEIKREFIYGRLSSIKEASFPILSSVGGVIVPAIIFTIFNYSSGFEIGAGIPLSTDIAFAVGVFLLLKKRLNPSLKVFLLTLAVVDDLISILIIGFFYSSHIRISGIIISVLITIVLFTLSKFNKKAKIYPYIILGLLLWGAIFYSGVHSTLSGVILAFSIPVLDDEHREEDLNYKIKHALEPYSNYLILPLFAFANTGINLSGDLNLIKDYQLMIGIILGLVIGKPVGIMLFGYVGTLLGIAKKSNTASWFDVLSVSILAGIGFTMSLFVSEIAFSGHSTELNVSKVSILVSLVVSITATYIITAFKKSSYRNT